MKSLDILKSCGAASVAIESIAHWVTDPVTLKELRNAQLILQEVAFYAQGIHDQPTYADAYRARLIAAVTPTAKETA